MGGASYCAQKNSKKKKEKWETTLSTPLCSVVERGEKKNDFFCCFYLKKVCGCLIIIFDHRTLLFCAVERHELDCLVFFRFFESGCGKGKGEVEMKKLNFHRTFFFLGVASQNLRGSKKKGVNTQNHLVCLFNRFIQKKKR